MREGRQGDYQSVTIRSAAGEGGLLLGPHRSGVRSVKQYMLAPIEPELGWLTTDAGTYTDLSPVHPPDRTHERKPKQSSGWGVMAQLPPPPLRWVDFLQMDRLVISAFYKHTTITTLVLLRYKNRDCCVLSTHNTHDLVLLQCNTCDSCTL